MKSNNELTKTEKQQRKRKIILSIGAILIFLIVFIVVYIYSTLGKINKVNIAKDNSSLGIDSTYFNTDVSKDIINIAFLGVDKREGDVGRSDATLVLTIDKKHNKTKISSFLRDCYVPIEGHGKTKLNHAYAYGGPQLSIKTLNENFGLNIKDFVKVNFSELSHVIDAVGGVNVTIKDYEVKEVNKYIDDVAKETNQASKHITAGSQILSGVQAVGYTRVRYAGNGDVERTERQRTVLNSIFYKIKSSGASQYPNIVNQILPYVETSMSSSEILNLGLSMISSGLSNLEQQEFPLENYRKGQIINNVWYWVFDETATKEHVRKYIFEDINPTSK